MFISRCHKSTVYVLTDYYICDNCGKSCDIVSSPTWMRDRHDDTRYDAEAQAIFG